MRRTLGYEFEALRVIMEGRNSAHAGTAQSELALTGLLAALPGVSAPLPGGIAIASTS